VKVAAPLVFAELVRAPGRTVLRVLTLAAAVGLLGAMVLFVGHSLGTMTGSAVRSVPLDWQGPVGSGHAAKAIAHASQEKAARHQGSLPARSMPHHSHIANVGSAKNLHRKLLSRFASPRFTRLFLDEASGY
jgi:hypothetical protein